MSYNAPFAPTTAEKYPVYHVLPNLAVDDRPEVWEMVIDLLRSRGLSREEALTRIRFAYTGSLVGELPPGVE